MPIATIVGFAGSWGSGLASLVVKARGGTRGILCGNAPTVRALDSAFPDFIADGHCVDNEAIAGKRIRYEVDEYGVLAGFEVVV